MTYIFVKKHFVKLIASAKFRSMRGASHQPAFMSGCLTISHVFVLSTSLGERCVGKGGSIVCWEGGKGV